MKRKLKEMVEKSMTVGGVVQATARCAGANEARYSNMRITTIHLFQGADGEEAYAIRLPEDPENYFRAERGFANDLHEVWTVEFETEEAPDRWETNWDAVMNRVVEAYSMHDPIVSGYHWPAVGIEV